MSAPLTTPQKRERNQEGYDAHNDEDDAVFRFRLLFHEIPSAARNFAGERVMRFKITVSPCALLKKSCTMSLSLTLMIRIGGAPMPPPLPASATRPPAAKLPVRGS